MEKLKKIILNFEPKILEPKKHEKLLFSFVDKVVCAYIMCGGRHNNRVTAYRFMAMFEVINDYQFSPDNPNEINWDEIEKFIAASNGTIKISKKGISKIYSYCKQFPNDIIEFAMIYYYGRGDYEIFNDIFKLLKCGISFVFGDAQYIKMYTPNVNSEKDTDLCAALIDNSFGEPKYEVYNLSQRCEILLRINSYLKSENVATYLQLSKYSNVYSFGDILFQDALKTLISENVIKKEENGRYSLVS